MARASRRYEGRRPTTAWPRDDDSLLPLLAEAEKFRFAVFDCDDARSEQSSSDCDEDDDANDGTGEAFDDERSLDGTKENWRDDDAEGRQPENLLANIPPTFLLLLDEEDPRGDALVPSLAEEAVAVMMQRWVDDEDMERRSVHACDESRAAAAGDDDDEVQIKMEPTMEEA